MNDKLKMIAMVTALILIVGFGLKTTKTRPPQGPVLLDTISGLYATPGCVLNRTVSGRYINNPAKIIEPGAPLVLARGVSKTTLGAVRGKWKPDPKCRDAGGFQ